MGRVSDSTRLHRAIINSASNLPEKSKYTCFNALVWTLCTGLMPVHQRLYGDIKNLFVKLVNTFEENDYRLQKSIYMHFAYKTGFNAARKISNTPVGEFREIAVFLKELCIPVEKVISEKPLELGRDWRNDVEKTQVAVDVYISNKALESLMLAAMECYLVSKGKGFKYTEVFGVCFGNSRFEDGHNRISGIKQRQHIHIERFVAQIRGEATASEVVPNPKSLGVQHDIREIFFPHEDIVGFFHTHPYRTRAYVQNPRIGIIESKHDKELAISWQKELYQLSGDIARVSVILAIGRTKNEKNTMISKRRKDNVIDFAFKNYACAVSCYRIGLDGSTSSDGLRLYCHKLLRSHE